ncbi:MAG: type III polyketide synthase [Proteobacteria bacterium]|nr:type III polyketide synthase [Pseudomonadota bacterium]
MARAHINRIGTATPPHDVHAAFLKLIDQSLADPRERRLFAKMAERAAIEHRFSDFQPADDQGRVTGDTEGFYTLGGSPSTGERMARFEAGAPRLAMRALDALGLEGERERITHLIVASCTGFVAPGLDQLIVKGAGLDPGVERTVVGFMGCYAAVNALRLAHHIVRSEPAARVLVVNLELCTLHFQQTTRIQEILSMMLFGDGCSAALVTADETGVALKDFRAATIADTLEAITWRIGDHGFDMHLSGEVPGKIAQALAAERDRNDEGGLLRGQRPEDFDLWAVHAGGRTILDAVETGFQLAPAALGWSRGVLRDFGNMSSATLMFVLQRILNAPRSAAEGAGAGFAVAFGPGLAAESFRFQLV